MPALRPAYEELGEGDPWVLLHAFPLHRKMWDGQRVLADRARLVLPDLRGLGQSPVAVPGSVDAMAEDVLGLCDDLGVERFGLLGLSLGGYVALALHELAPHRVGRLILADTQAGPDDEATRQARDHQASAVQEEGVGPLVEKLLPKLLSAKGREDKDLVTAVRGMAVRNSPQGTITTLHAMRDRRDLRPHLKTIRCPTLVLVGSEDAITPPAIAREMATAVRFGQYTELPGAGHLSNLEAPGAFTDAVRRFMAPGLDAQLQPLR